MCPGPHVGAERVLAISPRAPQRVLRGHRAGYRVDLVAVQHVVLGMAAPVESQQCAAGEERGDAPRQEPAQLGAVEVVPDLAQDDEVEGARRPRPGQLAHCEGDVVETPASRPRHLDSRRRAVHGQQFVRAKGEARGELTDGAARLECSAVAEIREHGHGDAVAPLLVARCPELPWIAQVAILFLERARGRPSQAGYAHRSSTSNGRAKRSSTCEGRIAGPRAPSCWLAKARSAVRLA